MQAPRRQAQLLQLQALHMRAVQHSTTAQAPHLVPPADINQHVVHTSSNMSTTHLPGNLCSCQSIYSLCASWKKAHLGTNLLYALGGAQRAMLCLIALMGNCRADIKEHALQCCFTVICAASRLPNNQPSKYSGRSLDSDILPFHR